jgi:hypothetical protein
MIACACAFAGCGGGESTNDLNGPADVVQPDAAGDEGAQDVATVDENEPRDTNGAQDGVVPQDSSTDATEDTGTPSDTVETDTSDVPVTSTETNYLVIASDSLVDSANELAAYRAGQGYRTEVLTRSDVLGSTYASTVQWEGSARGVIRQRYTKLKANETLFVVLVGDAEAVSDEGFTKPIPTEDCENVLTDVCFTDNRIADMDGDNVPDVAIGRITASNNDEVRAYLDKVERHESAYRPGLWNRRVTLYVGEAGFSTEIDSMLEYFTFQGLDRISHAFDIIGAYDSENSTYYYSPFHEKVVELINSGSLISMYIGHGNEDWTQGLTTEQLGEINCVNRLPIMVFLACLNGNFDNDDDSISEAMLHMENGPVAVFASSDESHPVGNAVLAYEITRVGLGERPATVGQLFMRTKAEMINHTDDFREMIDQASIAYGDNGEVGCDDPELLYRQHADLYNLLGDPAVLMLYPAASVDDVQVTGSLASKSLTVTGTVSGFTSGTAYVTAEVTRNEYVGALNPEPSDDAEIQANWEIANTKAFAAATVDIADGHFTAGLSWTDTIGSGVRYIKVYAWDGTEIGSGTVDAIAEQWINK